MIIPSYKYPTISYEPGEDLIVLPLESGLPFTLEVDKEITANSSDMSDVGDVLDEMDVFLNRLKGFIGITALNKDCQFNWEVKYFMDAYREELRERYPEEINEGSLLPFKDWCLKVVSIIQPQYLRYGYVEEREEYLFTLGLNFPRAENGHILKVGFNSELSDLSMDCIPPSVQSSQWKLFQEMSKR